METVWEFAKKVPGLREEILHWNLKKIAQRTKFRTGELDLFTIAEYNRRKGEISLDLGKVFSVEDLRSTIIHELIHGAGLGELAARYAAAISSKERIDREGLFATARSYAYEDQEKLEKFYGRLLRFGKLAAWASLGSAIASAIAARSGHEQLAYIFHRLFSGLLGSAISVPLFFFLRNPRKEAEELFRRHTNYGEVRFLHWFRKRGKRLGIEPTRENYEKFVGDREDAFRDLFLLSVNEEDLARNPFEAYGYAPPGWLEREEGRRWIKEVSKNPELAQRILSKGPQIPRWFFKEKAEEERSNKFLSFLRRRLKLPERTKL